MIIKTDEIVGYNEDGRILCKPCAGDWEDANADQIITQDDLQRAEDNGEVIYCDECNGKLPVLPDEAVKEVKVPPEMKRRWWVELGRWEGEGGDREMDLAVKRRLTADIPGIEYSGGDSPSFVFKTWDEEEAKAVLNKALKIITDIAPQAEGYAETLDYRAQPQCPKCEALGRFSSQFCEACGTKLV